MALAPALVRRPPMTKVGSRPPCASTDATRLVVVVLPWVPAMAMPRFRRINSPSITARGTSGILRARAATTSGLSCGTAVDVTTASASPMFSAAWPEHDGRAQARQALRGRIAAQVGARHVVAEVEQHFGDAAHAAAANADEVDIVYFMLHRANLMPVFPIRVRSPHWRRACLLPAPPAPCAGRRRASATPAASLSDAALISVCGR